MPYRKKQDHTTRNAVLVVAVVAVIFILLAQHNTSPLNSSPTASPTPNNGTPIISVYDDGSAKLSSGSLDWGTLQGSSITKEVHVQNMGTHAINSLSITASDWTPPDAANDLSLAWEYASGSSQLPLQPGGEMLVDLTLTVSPNANLQELTNFGFTVVVTAN